eukprot:764443-Hanusia_phi.AAC.12
MQFCSQGTPCPVEKLDSGCQKEFVSPTRDLAKGEGDRVDKTSAQFLKGCEGFIEEIQRSAMGLEVKLEELMMKLDSKRIDEDTFVSSMVDSVNLSNCMKERVLQDLVWAEEDLDNVKQSLSEERTRNEELLCGKAMLESEIEALAERLIKEQILLDSLRIDREEDAIAKQTIYRMVEAATREILREVGEMKTALSHVRENEHVARDEQDRSTCDVDANAEESGRRLEQEMLLLREVLERKNKELDDVHQRWQENMVGREVAGREVETLRETLAKLQAELRETRREKQELENSCARKVSELQAEMKQLEQQNKPIQKEDEEQLTWRRDADLLQGTNAVKIEIARRELHRLRAAVLLPCILEVEELRTHVLQEEDERTARIEILTREKEELKERLGEEEGRRAREKREEREKYEHLVAEVHRATVWLKEVLDGMSEAFNAFESQKAQEVRDVQEKRELQALRLSVKIAAGEMVTEVNELNVQVSHLQACMTDVETANRERSSQVTREIARAESICRDVERKLKALNQVNSVTEEGRDVLMCRCEGSAMRATEELARCLWTCQLASLQSKQSRVMASALAQQVLEELRWMEEEVEGMSTCYLDLARRSEDKELQTSDCLARLDKLACSLCAGFSLLEEKVKAVVNDQAADRMKFSEMEASLSEARSSLIKAETEKQKLETLLCQHTNDKKMLFEVIEQFNALGSESLQICGDEIREKQELVSGMESEVMEERKRLHSAFIERDVLVKKVQELEDQVGSNNQLRLKEEIQRDQMTMRVRSLEEEVEKLSDVIDKVGTLERLLQELSQRNSLLCCDLQRQQQLVQELTQRKTSLEEKLSLDTREALQEKAWLAEISSLMYEDCALIEEYLREMRKQNDVSSSMTSSYLQAFNCLEAMQREEIHLFASVKSEEVMIVGHVNSQIMQMDKQVEEISQSLLSSCSLISHERIKSGGERDEIERRVKELETLKSVVENRLFLHCKELSHAQETLNQCHVTILQESSSLSASYALIQRWMVEITDGVQLFQKECQKLQEEIAADEKCFDQFCLQLDAISSTLLHLCCDFASRDQRLLQENERLRESSRQNELALLACRREFDAFREAAEEKERAIHSDFQERLDYVDEMAEDEKARLREQIGQEQQASQMLDQELRALGAALDLVASVLLAAVACARDERETVKRSLVLLLAKAGELESLVDSVGLRWLDGLEEEDKHVSSCERLVNQLGNSLTGLTDLGHASRENATLRGRVLELERRLEQQEEELVELQEAKQRASGSMHQQEVNLIEHISEMMEEVARQRSLIDRLTSDLEATRAAKDEG